MEVALENISDPESKDKSKLMILIVEDDFASFRVLKEYLSEYGDCSVAVNGIEAVEAFRNASDKGRPYDMICLDIMLPEMNGLLALEQIRRIKQECGTRQSDSIKVIVTTAMDDSDDIIKAFKEGCRAYIVKPITREKLFAEMRKLSLIK